MIPVEAFQDALKVKLLADPVIAKHVAPAHIRVGTLRPTQLPAIVISPTRASILGRASGGQIVAELRAMLHVWTKAEGDHDAAQDISSAAVMALMDAPKATGFAVDDWDRPALVWTDQAAGVSSTSTGAIGLRAVIRWCDK